MKETAALCRQGTQRLYEAVARDLRERLDPFIRKNSPLSEPVKKPKATWVEPVIRGRSRLQRGDGKRPATGSRVQGRARGPAIASPVRGATQAIARREQPRSSGVPRENILPLLPDAVPPSKEELAAYWDEGLEAGASHLGRRPLKLVRQVEARPSTTKAGCRRCRRQCTRLTIEKREGGEGTGLWVDDLAGLLGLVEIGAVELHPGTRASMTSSVPTCSSLISIRARVSPGTS